MIYEKLAVVGSRLKEKTSEQIEYSNKVSEILFAILERFHKKYSPTLLISGGASGIDSKAELWADSKNISKFIIRPNWYPNGHDKPMDRGAGFKRNKLIIDAADYVIAMTTGSNGTANSIEWAKKLNKPLAVFDMSGILLETRNLKNP